MPYRCRRIIRYFSSRVESFCFFVEMRVSVAPAGIPNRLFCHQLTVACITRDRKSIRNAFTRAYTMRDRCRHRDECQRVIRCKFATAIYHGGIIHTIPIVSCAIVPRCPARTQSLSTGYILFMLMT